MITATTVGGRSPQWDIARTTKSRNSLATQELCSQGSLAARVGAMDGIQELGTLRPVRYPPNEWIGLSHPSRSGTLVRCCNRYFGAGKGSHNNLRPIPKIHLLDA